MIKYYLDDMIIPAIGWDDLLTKLRQVFFTIHTAKLILKPSKCVFGKSTLEFLGFLIIYRIVNDEDLFVAPKTMRKELTIAAHDLAGNFAADYTVEKLQKDFWFDNMRRYVKQHIKMCMCIDYLVNRRPGGRQEDLLHPIPPGN